MSEPTPEVCRKCGANQHTMTVAPIWECGSKVIASVWWQSNTCYIRELEAKVGQ